MRGCSPRRRLVPVPVRYGHAVAVATAPTAGTRGMMAPGAAAEGKPVQSRHGAATQHAAASRTLYGLLENLDEALKLSGLLPHVRLSSTTARLQGSATERAGSFCRRETCGCWLYGSTELLDASRKL